MTSSFIQTYFSLDQFLLYQPSREVGVVIPVIEERATVYEQVNSVACCQSQGGDQGNGIVTPRSRL